MTEEHLTETFVSGGIVFNGHLLKVQRDLVRLPDETQAQREFVRHPGACVIIPEIRPGILVFERQFRYPLGQVFIELPAGKIDPGDTLLGCAKRELLEETGYQAEHWQYVGRMHNCIGYSDEKIEIFLAQGLIAGQVCLDEGEFIQTFEMSLEEAEDAVLRGFITDAKTITCLFWARRILRV